jgi:DNA helicase-2/ATP-dependent DNA helicase PcrA
MEMLDEISLLTDAKGDEKSNTNAVKLMTAHASKGLEFDSVFIVGSEEGLFPHINSIQTHNIEDIEEERRLYYVAMTRAQKKLYITYAKNKKSNNEGYQPVTESRFIYEIPETLREYTL